MAAKLQEKDKRRLTYAGIGVLGFYVLSKSDLLRTFGGGLGDILNNAVYGVGDFFTTVVHWDTAVATFEPVRGNTSLINRLFNQYDPYWLTEESRVEAETYHRWSDMGYTPTQQIAISTAIHSAAGNDAYSNPEGITGAQTDQVIQNIKNLGYSPWEQLKLAGVSAASPMGKRILAGYKT